jgi:hypothetical protein
MGKEEWKEYSATILKWDVPLEGIESGAEGRMRFLDSPQNVRAMDGFSATGSSDRAALF